MSPDNPQANSLERWLKIAGITLTLAGLLAGTYQFTRNQSVEAARPFLERKLKWCEEAVEVAAGIAAHGRDSALPAVAPAQPMLRVKRFMALYWGVMGMVESKEVIDAMNVARDSLISGNASLDGHNALAIAHACRNEMARDWSPAWKR
jgi:hypothetical protein